MAKEPLKADERQKVLEARLKSIGLTNKQMLRGDAVTSLFTEYISTGLPEIDNIIGDLPGIACGSVVEFVGESMSGKSFVAMKCVAEAHKKNKRVAWLNVENSFYVPRAEALGVQASNPDLFEIYKDVGSGEKWGELAKMLVKTGEYAYVVIDSVTAMIPSVDYEKSLEDASQIGAHARMCSRLAQKLTQLCAESDTTTILINQFRYGSGLIKGTFAKKPTGGEGIGFYAHTRLTFAKVNGVAGEVYNKDKEIIGVRSRVMILKTRFGQPGNKIDFPIYFSAVESDPLVEFLMRAKSKQYELIKEVRKVLRYNTEDGEVIESKNPKEFILKLWDTPSPTNKSKNDTSKNALEYICRKIKYDQDMVNKLLEKAKTEDELDLAPPDGLTALADLSFEEQKAIFDADEYTN